MSEESVAKVNDEAEGAEGGEDAEAKTRTSSLRPILN